MGIADRNFHTFKAETLAAAQVRIKASPEAGTAFDVTLQSGVDMRELGEDGKPTNAMWAAFTKGLEEGDSPNVKDRSRMVKALLGCSNRGSMGAKRAKENGGGLCRDSVEATRVVLRDVGVESFSQLIAYFTNAKTPEQTAVDAMAKAAIDKGGDTDAYLLTLVAKAAKKVATKKAAGVKANEAKVKEAAKKKAAREKINAKAAEKRARAKAKAALKEAARLAKLVNF